MYSVLSVQCTSTYEYSTPWILDSPFTVPHCNCNAASQSAGAQRQPRAVAALPLLLADVGPADRQLNHHEGAGQEDENQKLKKVQNLW